MTKITAKTEVKVEVTFTLNEIEVRALAGIFGYNVDAFLAVFYQQMGSHYVRPFEEGVRSLHKTINAVCGPVLAQANELRRKMKASGL